jgi:hypothetical protein
MLVVARLDNLDIIVASLDVGQTRYLGYCCLLLDVFVILDNLDVIVALLDVLVRLDNWTIFYQLLDLKTRIVLNRHISSHSVARDVCTNFYLQLSKVL